MPENAFVFCCFNAPHKISRFTWKRWMEILNRVPNSVLWLLDGPQTTMERLHQMAAEVGIPKERIIFAPKLRNADHLARYPLADLFLDTWPYGAHTTSSDALWMSVPLLTLPGRSFASRVCGSLVKSAGMEELICATPEAYVQLAIDLANDPPRLAALRQKLAANRDTCTLFNTPLLVERLEGLYAEMWAEYRAGKLHMPNLTNLDVYNDVGMELDRDEVEMLAQSDYLDQYRRVLGEKARSVYLAPDPRLWPGTPSP